MSIRNRIAVMLIPLVAACATPVMKSAERARWRGRGQPSRAARASHHTRPRTGRCHSQARLAEVGVTTIEASDGSQSLRLPGGR